MSIVDGRFSFPPIYKSRRSFSFFEYKSKKRMCAPREREMTIQRIYHHGRIFRRGGPPSAAHPSLFSFVFCSMSSKEREVLFEEDSFLSSLFLYVCCLLDSRTCSFLFLLKSSSFALCVTHTKRNLSPPRVYTRRRERSASRYPPIRSSRAERASF